MLLTFGQAKVCTWVYSPKLRVRNTSIGAFCWVGIVQCEVRFGA